MPHMRGCQLFKIDFAVEEELFAEAHRLQPPLVLMTRINRDGSEVAQ